MRKSLVTPLFATTLLQAHLSIFSPSASFSKGSPFPGLFEFAKKVTLRVETPASGGSAVIVGKKGGKYIAMTAHHVVLNVASGENAYVTHDSSPTVRYKIEEVLRPGSLKQYDLALITFSSSKDLEIAPIFSLAPDDKNPWRPRVPEHIAAVLEKTCFEYIPLDGGKPWYPSEECRLMKTANIKIMPVMPADSTYIWSDEFNGRSYDPIYGNLGEPIVGGFSIPTAQINTSIFRTAPVELLARAAGNDNGYEMPYLATSTVPGMSGGGVLGARKCPNSKNSFGFTGSYGGIIGVHGRSEEYGSSGSRSGVSLAVPLDLVKDTLASMAAQYGIPTGSSYVNLIRKNCTSSPGMQ